MGKGSLTLPIPSSAPECLKSLLTNCWNQRPANRPTFQQIQKNLEISKAQIILFEQEQEYAELTRIWSAEINEHLAKLPTIDISSILQLSNEELIEKRQEELQHIADIRLLYEKRLEQVNSIYIQLKSFMMQLEQREQLIQEKEFHLKKRAHNPILQARKKSLEIIKAATSNLNDPMYLLSHKKFNRFQQTKLEEISPIGKNIQRRKKGSGHRRNNSKGSARSWAPPSLNSIENQEKRRASIDFIPHLNEQNLRHDQRVDTSIPTSNESPMNSKEKINSPIPSSNHVDETIVHSRQRRRRTIKSSDEIDSHPQSRSVTFQLSPSIVHCESMNSRKILQRISYTSSEEGEAEEIHSNQDVFNDEIYRAKHAQSFVNFSSESEIYLEQNSSSKIDGKIFFDYLSKENFIGIFRRIFR